MNSMEFAYSLNFLRQVFPNRNVYIFPAGCGRSASRAFLIIHTEGYHSNIVIAKAPFPKPESVLSILCPFEVQLVTVSSSPSAAP